VSKHKLFGLLVEVGRGGLLGLEDASFHPGQESFNLIFGNELADGVEDCVFGEVG
jgi:hypothetical protein